MEILQVYISLIRVFAVLDTKGVLVDRVARPIRRYLRDREDTVKVIVNGLLARPRVNAEDGARADNNVDDLTDLATELDRDVHRLAQSDDDQEFDWDDMQWTPDPIDAGPGR
jgi:anaphase-promoting complex subunit 2